ncbi:hypothetical protein [Marinifilum caeruleilacunae]|uniref:Lipoprotein n=1 Tax=Marinifilum caeruleilacunae TaxID=2499076 RepID=A0ABX1WQZ3_9BACT|nr:hypothetical protein [Marinifilum caeruleilacunae]NOU58509.1 hypothetical protein [Marinifilum caeruleilacunae]
MMKLPFLFLCLSIILLSCNSETKKNLSKESQIQPPPAPIVNSDLIEDFHSSLYLDSLLTNRKRKKLAEIRVHENSDSCKIILNTLVEWNDPGDFLNVQILNSKGKETLSINNIDGWMKCVGPYKLPESVHTLNVDKSGYTLIIDNKTGKQLVLFGYSYASQPGLMTIIDLFPEPKIIFNKQFDLHAISKVSTKGIRNYIGETELLKEVVLNMELMIIEE